MQLSTQQDDYLTIVTVLDSRLDASIAPEFKDQMKDIINTASNHIILDISAITFMDSSSLGAMVVVFKAIGNQRQFVISGATGVVLELFKLTRMDNVFILANNVEHAKTMLSETIA